MARERYLVGVDPEELKKRPAPQAPQTPQGKWENFWYHYKWLTIGVVIALIIGAFLLYHTLTRTEPDYFICMVTSSEVSIDSDARLEELLTPYATDRNGDGEVIVQIQCLNVGKQGERNDILTSNQQGVLGHIAARDVDIWMVDPNSSFYLESLPSMADGDPDSWFYPLNEQGDRFWDWTDAPLLKDEDLWSVPKTLYWGIFDRPDATAEDKAEIEEMIRFIEAVAKSQE